MRLKTISKQEFDQLNDSQKLLCSDSDYRQIYGSLELDSGLNLAVCWHSETILPQILETKFNSIWIGIDQKLIGLNKSDGKLLIYLNLFSNFQKFIQGNDFISVVTELELLNFNKDGSLRSNYSFPEIIESVSVVNNNAVVCFIDGGNSTIQI